MGKTFTVTVKGQDQEFESKFDVLDEAIEALIAKGNRSQFALDLVAKHHSYGLSAKQAGARAGGPAAAALPQRRARPPGRAAQREAWESPRPAGGGGAEEVANGASGRASEGEARRVRATWNAQPAEGQRARNCWRRGAK